jgi:hypothetical protein
VWTRYNPVNVYGKSPVNIEEARGPRGERPRFLLFSRKVNWAFIYGSVAHAKELATSDVDLIIIGDGGLADRSRALGRVEEQLSRAEFGTKGRAELHVLATVLDAANLCIRGERRELAATTAQLPRLGTCRKPRRTSGCER